MSSKTSIQLDDSAVRAFNELKDNLIAQIELVQPDYNIKFTLTTDASDLAIGAVRSQEGKPITFISRTLTKAEQIYATNKKELLAIVWAFKNFAKLFIRRKQHRNLYRSSTTVFLDLSKKILTSR